MYFNLKKKAILMLDGNPIRIYYTHQNITFISMVDVCEIIGIPYDKVDINKYRGIDKEEYVLDLKDTDDILFTYTQISKLLKFYDERYIINYLEKFIYRESDINLKVKNMCCDENTNNFNKMNLCCNINLAELKSNFQNALEIAELAGLEDDNQIIAANIMIHNLFNINILDLLSNDYNAEPIKTNSEHMCCNDKVAKKPSKK